MELLTSDWAPHIEKAVRAIAAVVVAVYVAGLITGTFTSLDTAAAGTFAAEGSWSLRYTGGDVYAQWTATSAIPEPATYGLLGAGALALTAMVRRRRKLAA